jgi:tRNA dimethylallyltransferase
MSENTVSIVGVTGSGKTEFALAAAELLLSEHKYDHVALISADSRQVYKGLEVLSGADIPHDFVQQDPASDVAQYPYFISPKKSISLHGQSIVAPSTHWSLAHFKELVENVRSLFQNTKTAFLIVGGTGLYHRWLYQDDVWLPVEPDEALRHELKLATVEELQNRLQVESPEWFAALNHSDQQNPRRLVRAIERARAGNSPDNRQQQSHNTSWIGLKDDADNRAERIKDRVVKRLRTGAIQEVENLLRLFPDQQLPAYSTIGVRQLSRFLQQETSKQEMISSWALAEVQYCKRQQTWFARENVFWM